VVAGRLNVGSVSESWRFGSGIVGQKVIRFAFVRHLRVFDFFFVLREIYRNKLESAPFFRFVRSSVR
jgi:hypothetical protein